jgi:hypothetical protein
MSGILVAMSAGMISLRRIASCVLVAAAATTAHAESPAPSRLQNDGWLPGAQLGFNPAPVAEDAVASRFLGGGGNLLGVHLVFGGATTAQSVTIKVWEDIAGTVVPGTELFSGDFLLSGSDNLQFVALPGVFTPFQFRIGVVAHHTGAPSIAFDRDGTITPDANFVMKQGVWQTSSEPGDWIIRAELSTGGGGGGDGGLPEACVRDQDCPTGLFCDPTQRACTFECKTDEHCNGAPCSSHGQCLYGNAGDTGCCRTDSGGYAGALLGLAVLVLVRRRVRPRVRA